MSGDIKGFAFVEFSKKEEADSAVTVSSCHLSLALYIDLYMHLNFSSISRAKSRLILCLILNRLMCHVTLMPCPQGGRENEKKMPTRYDYNKT